MIAIVLIQAFGPLGVRPAYAVPQAKENLQGGLAKGSKYGSGWGDYQYIPEPVQVLPPQEEQQAPEVGNSSPRIKASVSPEMYIPGKPFQLQWDVIGGEGQQARAAASLEVRIKSSKGVFPVDANLKKATQLTEDGMNQFSLAVDARNALEWDVDETTEFPIFLNVELVDGEEVIAQQAILLDKPKFETGAKGGSFTALEGRVKVTVPASAAGQALYFDVRNPSPQRLPSISLTGFPVEIISAGKTTGVDVKKFNEPITIQMQFDPDKVYGGDASSLSLYYYDETLADWFPLPTTVDTANQTLTAQSDHLTIFDYKANNWQTNSLPTVDSFKVADFTGAATYSLSLWTPPGPAGMKPDLTLYYNSQVIDESSAFSQASWVGMGWSLETGSITRNMHGTDGNESDDTFSISVGGISGTLLPISASGNIITFKTADDSFAKVEYHNTTDAGGFFNSEWRVWGKDGVNYVFAQRAMTNTEQGCSKEPDITKPANGGIVWKWSLTSVTDTSGNQMVYDYTTERKDTWSDELGTNCKNEIAAYPNTITYPNGKYRVKFNLLARSDYQASWTDVNSRAFYGRSRLDKIEIQHFSGGAWGTVRQYIFGYAPASTSIYPQFTWSQGGPTLTLTRVQEAEPGVTNCASTPGQCLPPATFTYGDAMHVTEFNNGQGGKVAVSYEQWYYPDDSNDDLRSLLIRFNQDECYKSNGQTFLTSWTEGSGTVACQFVIENNKERGRLRVGNGSPVTLGMAWHTLPEHVAKPGAHFRAAISAYTADTQGDPRIMTYGFKDKSSGNITQVTGSVGVGYDNMTSFGSSFEMPVHYNPRQTELFMECRNCLVVKYQFAVMPSYWRVVSRTVRDLAISTTEPIAVYSYRYDNPSPNNDTVSEAVRTISRERLYTPGWREYRGHAMTQVTDGTGLSTLNWYYQSDALKGRAYRSLTMQETFPHESFDALNGGWTNGGASIEKDDLDPYALLTTTATNWPVHITRSAATLTNGRMAIAHFRLSSSQTQAELGLSSGSGKFFGVIVKPEGGAPVARLRYNTGGGLQDGGVLIPAGSFSLDKWYGLMLFVDNDDGFRARVWQQDNPSILGETTLAGFSAEAWRFQARVNSAVSGQDAALRLDAYSEGIPYAESVTTYAVVKQYDSIAGGAIPDLANSSLVASYDDLAIHWVYPTQTIQRNYNGDAAFTSTRSVYTYDTTPPNYGYGNLLRQTDYAWNGSGWAPYRGTKTDYFPNTSGGKYLVGLPARQVALDCTGGACDFSGESGLMAETLNIYDSNSVYSASPTTGFLTRQRLLAKVDEYGVRKYMETAYTYQNGNVASVTTYKNFGAANASPAGESYTSYKGYNDYNTYVTMKQTCSSSPLPSTTITAWGSQPA